MIEDSWPNWFTAEHLSVIAYIIAAIAAVASAVLAWRAARSSSLAATSMQRLENRRLHNELRPNLRIKIDQLHNSDRVVIEHDDGRTYLISGTYMGGVTLDRDAARLRAKFPISGFDHEVRELGPGIPVVSPLPLAKLPWRLCLAIDVVGDELRCPCGRDDAANEASDTEVHGHWTQYYTIPH